MAVRMTINFLKKNIDWKTTLTIAFWTALILGFVFFPAHMIMIGIFLVLVAMAIGFISIALKTNDEINSSISDDDAFMAYYLLEKKKKEENKS